MSYNQSIIYDTEDEDDEKDDFFDYLVHWCQSIPKNIRRQLTGTWEMEQWIRAQNHLARMLKIKDATHRKTRTTGTRTTCSFFVSRSNRTNSPHGINNNHPDGHHNNLPLNTMDCSSCLSVSCCLENPHIWLCIAEFLTATNLVHLSHLSRTNSFFRNLVHQHAAATLYRTQTITTTSADTRIQPPPSSILEHVRAMEIIQGNLEYDDDQHENGSVAIDNHADEDSHRHHRHGIQRPKNMVPIRITLPMQKIIVTNAGDTEYNGIYCCTSFDGNGYVFTKPRRSTLRQQQRRVLFCILSKGTLLFYVGSCRKKFTIVCSFCYIVFAFVRISYGT
jgi:hypothetical protein